MPTLGYVLWEGASLLSGDPVVVIANKFSRSTSNNKKTGAMVQTWILCQNLPPNEAVKTRADSAICGSCLHRGATPSERTCYVNVGRAPTAVWKAYHRGRYDRSWAPSFFADRLVRIGSYGDPAAVPVDVWDQVCLQATGWTGYTHQWRTSSRDLSRYCMASVDSTAERDEAKALGWRTFRVTKSTDYARQFGEASCPASQHMNNLLQCVSCLSCNGTAGSSRRGDIVIPAHGLKHAVKTFDRIAA
jgi:hypothetical protein